MNNFFKYVTERMNIGLPLGSAGHILAVGLLLSPLDAIAYIGPGLGSGAVAAILGIVAGLLMLIVGVVWYPIKRLARFLRSRKKQ